MKLLAFTLVLLLSGTEAFAMSAGSERTKILCEEGYAFLLVYSVNSNTSPTVVQIMEESEIAGGPPQPMKCDK